MTKNDCKTCKHATVLYERERSDRFSGAYAPAGLVRCSGPRYGKRVYVVRDNRRGCRDYEKRERTVEGKGGE